MKPNNNDRSKSTARGLGKTLFLVNL